MPITQDDSAKIARLEERVSRQPSSALFLPLAEAYREQGRAADAERVLRQGLAHHKEHFSARTALGRILLELGQAQDALRELERVHRAVPENLLAARLLDQARTQAEEAGQAPQEPAAELHSPAVPDPAPPLPVARRQGDPPADPPLDSVLATPDPSVQRRVLALRRFLGGARRLRGHHA